jgi:hypothetical protein
VEGMRHLEPIFLVGQERVGFCCFCIREAEDWKSEYPSRTRR